MDMRAQVYSPLQNIAVWLASWLFEYESTDAVIDALTSLGGTHTLADATGTAALLHTVRERADLSQTDEPVLSLVLAGPGDPAHLPPGVGPLVSGGALVVQGEKGARGVVHHVGIPAIGPTGMTWHWIADDTQWRPSPQLSPGEADLALADATRQAAADIESQGYHPQQARGARLQVGTLSDFYDIPGLPVATPPRAARLFARADRVAAIAETVIEARGEHGLDPQLMGLTRHVRAARMAGVAYAVRELGR